MYEIDCVEIATKEKKLIASEVINIQEDIKLVTIMIGNNPASEVYVRNKHKVCDEVEIKSQTMRFDEDVTQEEIIKTIHKLDEDNSVHGILVQLPLPKHIDPNIIAKTIAPKKDVDGFHPYNQGMLFRGEEEGYIKPCTPSGVMKVFEHLDYDLEEKDVVVIGRSNILGKPVAQMLMQEGATVLQLHSKSGYDLGKYFDNHDVDVIVSCVGKEDLFDYDDLPTWCLDIIIDCAIMRGEDGKLCGDFKKYDYYKLEEEGIEYTPVPKGIGTLTTTFLARNVLECYKLQIKTQDEKTEITVDDLQDGMKVLVKHYENGLPNPDGEFVGMVDMNQEHIADIEDDTFLCFNSLNTGNIGYDWKVAKILDKSNK